ncbi:MAG: peroxiredoxin [Alistipes sp.]|nr:peroxiredoxin [Alistipes sp.]
MDTEKNYSMPRIGDKAPSFKAVTTQGEIDFPADYKGRWKILFSHPSDFTPICTTEFVMFGKMEEEFAALNCQLVGLSVGALNSHIAWLRTIRDKIEFKGLKNVDIRFPLVADADMEIARSYGMIQPGASSTAAVRAVFFIDPADTIRAIIYYPLALGRNFDEIKRVLVGLQTIDNFHVALPADWREGDDIVVPAAANANDADKAMHDSARGMKCYDWFFCVRPLSKVEVEAKLYAKKE